MPDEKNTINIITADGEFHVHSPYWYKDVSNAIGGRWNASEKRWCYPATPDAAIAIRDAYSGCVCTSDEGYTFQLEKADESRDAISKESANCAAPVICRTSGSRPWPHQVEGFQRIYTNDAVFLAWDMGTGKSRAVVDAVVNLEVKLVLIVCPAAVVPGWAEQFNIHASDQRIRVVPLIGESITKRIIRIKKEEIRSGVSGETLVFVINYEAARVASMQNTLLGQVWDMVVADESHRLKSGQSVTSKFMGRLGRVAKRRVALTGTPMPHDPLDIWGQFRFLDPTIFPTYFTAFRDRYAFVGEWKNVMGHKNLDELHRLYYTLAHRVKKSDVLPDLPPVIHEQQYVELGAKARKAYGELEREFIAEVDEGVMTVSNALSRITRFQQLTGGHFQADDTDKDVSHDKKTVIDNSKRDALLDVMSGIGRDEPLVVFANFRFDLDQIQTASKKAGRSHFEFSGQTKELEEWKAAIDGGLDRGSVIGVQIAAGGTGLNGLTRACYCVYYSPGLNGGNYDQSLGRLDRQGQTRPVTLIHLIAKNTYDEQIYAAFSQQKRIVDMVLEKARG